MKDYMELANRTVSPSFYGDKVGALVLADGLKAVMEVCLALDWVKKALFYGKTHVSRTHDDGTVETISYAEEVRGPEEMPDCSLVRPAMYDILHGVLGVATEAGELVEAIGRTSLSEGKFDVTNVREEIGDVLWYLALLCKATDTTIEAEMERNIAKLRTRYPDKYTDEAASVRDLDAERQTLEEVYTTGGPNDPHGMGAR